MSVGCAHCKKRPAECRCEAPNDRSPLVRIPRDVERTIRERADTTIALLIERLQQRRAELVDYSVERATTIGVTEYGEAAWHKTPDQLLREIDDELADAIFYGGAREDVIEGLAR